MTKNYIVKELINQMKERIPPGHNLANYLTDTLYMGKEAVYRRLRGEVAFTFDEIAVISHNLGISIDQIIGNHLSNRVTFDLNLLHSPNLMESYYEIVERYLRIFQLVNGDENSETYSATNTIPFTLYSSYEYLSKFRICRWIYQNGKMKTPNSLSDMHVPEKIINAHKKLSESIRKVGKTYFVWDSNVFQSVVKEIKYFAGLNLISTSDVMYLKNELQQLLTDLEHLPLKVNSTKDMNYTSTCRTLILKQHTVMLAGRIIRQPFQSVFYQFDGLTKSPNLPDTKKLDTVFEKALHTDFGKWRGTEDCVY